MLGAHSLPANRAFQNRKSGWSEHDKWQNLRDACLQKQLQTALILSVTFI
jgi:hypothetical protein